MMLIFSDRKAQKEEMGNDRSNSRVFSLMPVLHIPEAVNGVVNVHLQRYIAVWALSSAIVKCLRLHRKPWKSPG
jgi:hypothetical protein